MKTYIINAAEIKNFDSNILFNLIDDTQIVWYRASLPELDKYAQKIFDQQNVLNAEPYRVVVIVDLGIFNGTHPKQKMGNVHNAADYTELYKTLVDEYVTCHIANYLTNKHSPASGFDIYHIQYVQSHNLDHNEKSEAQLRLIFPDNVDQDGKNKFVLNGSNFELDYKLKTKEDDPNTYVGFTDFKDLYNYVIVNGKSMVSQAKVSIHKYIAYDEDTIKSTYQTLSLLMYIIHVYGSKKKIGAQTASIKFDDIEDTITAEIHERTLKKTLDIALKRVNDALTKAREKKNVDYYKYDITNIKTDRPISDDATYVLPKIKHRFVDQYEEIKHYDETGVSTEYENSEGKMNSILESYQENRDNTRDDEDNDELFKNATQTKICPTENEYHEMMKQQKEKFKEKLDASLSVSFDKVDYSEMRKKSMKIKKEHDDSMSYIKLSIGHDILLFAIIWLFTIIPCVMLQRFENPFSNASMIVYGIVSATYFGIYLLAQIIHIFPHIKIILQTRKDMKSVYRECRDLDEKSWSTVFNLYQKTLLELETIRFDLFKLERIHSKNISNAERVKEHTRKLMELNSVLGSLQTSLGMEYNKNIVDDSDKTIDEIFNIEKPVWDESNSIYRIFSSEIIDKMFSDNLDSKE